MKPTIFISSTIYDFADLRSALKFYLEEFGYDVQLSETTDFKNDIEKSSYDACLNNIRRSQYFILLIGGRRGGLFTAEPKISITRKEYQVAYEEAKNGKLQIFTFVRSDIDILMHQYKKFETALLEGTVSTKKSTDEILGLFNKTSPRIDDHEHLKSFLNEVTRIDEMKDGVCGKCTLPVYNWKYSFSCFKEIIDVLKPRLDLQRSITTKALLELLGGELAENFNAFMIKHDNGRIIPYYLIFKEAMDNYTLSQKDDLQGHRQISKAIYDKIFISLIAMEKLPKLKVDYIKEACSHYELLNYDPTTGIHDQSNLFESIRRTYNAFLFFKPDNIATEIKRLRTTMAMGLSDTKTIGYTSVKIMDIVILKLYCYELTRCFLEAENLFKHLYYKNELESNVAGNIPRTPFEIQDKTTESEKVTIADLNTYYKKMQ